MNGQRELITRIRRAGLVLSIAMLLGTPVLLTGLTSPASGTWTTTRVLLAAPASPDLAVTSAGDATFVYAGDRLLRGVRGRWTSTATPYDGARMVAGTVDATGTYVAFETMLKNVPQHAGRQLWVGARSQDGRFSQPKKIAQPVNSGPMSAAVLARHGRWRAFFNEADCVDTACGGNGLFEVTDTGTRRRIASVPSSSGNLEGQLRPLDAAYLPGDVVAIIGRDDDTLEAGSSIRDRGPLWFGRGVGTSWGFAPLDARSDITSSDVIGRYGGLFVVYGRPGQVVDLTSDGRRWASPRSLPARGRPAGVRTAVSLGRQFLAWDDAAGLHLASRAVAGVWTTTTVTRAGSPRSLGLTAVNGKATLIYGVTTAKGLEVRSRTQH